MFQCRIHTFLGSHYIADTTTTVPTNTFVETKYTTTHQGKNDAGGGSRGSVRESKDSGDGEKSNYDPYNPRLLALASVAVLC